MANLKLSVLLAAVCILSCLAKNGDKMWEIFLPVEDSSSSRFYVLHDWSIGDGVYDSSVSSLFPAAQVSDIMLKTMGILREGVSWPGVKLGNLFRRPRASAVFVVDGLPDSEQPLMNFEGAKKFSVDQSGLTGSITNDLFALFKGDNVLRYLNRLFDEHSLTVSVSGDAALSRVIAPSSQPLPEPNLDAVLSQKSLSQFDMTSPVDSAFVHEVALVQRSIEKLSEMKEQVTDGAPDVYVFMFTTLNAVRAKYGDNSERFHAAVSVVHQLIQEANNQLVKVYNGDIIIQALTLSWAYQDVSEDQEQALRSVFKRYDVSDQEVNALLADLPIVYPPAHMTMFMQGSLCQDLAYFIQTEGGTMRADCVDELAFLHAQDQKLRLRRSSSDLDAGSGGDEGLIGIPFESNDTRIDGLVEERSNDFSAIFLIIFVVVVPLGLALFAVSWLMWNMDPGRDSIIYRNTDPAGMKMD